MLAFALLRLVLAQWLNRAVRRAGERSWVNHQGDARLTVNPMNLLAKLSVGCRMML